MGKWTPSYTDNVLHTKISALITGAINRAAVEKEPTITYDNFVHELDTGDAFTTSLIDILVKELAERHTRPWQNNERRLIAPRTADRLRALANPRQVYRGDRSTSRNHPGRRTINLAEFMNAPPTEMELDEDEIEFDSLLDPTTGAAEGARFNTDLFEAYGAHPWASIPRRIGSTPSPTFEEDAPVWRSSSMANRGSAWSIPPPTVTSGPGAATLTRHPSIRRPRSRMVDFSDWTSRRRSSTRESHGTQVDGSESRLRNSDETLETIRRFFPAFSRRPERRSEPWESGISFIPSSNAPPSVVDAPSTLDPHPAASTSEERTSAPTPRLRRGGVRAPEWFYSHRYSSSAGAVPPSSLEPLPRRTPSPRSVNNDVGSQAAEPVGYPTPGSVENEPTSTST